MTSRIGPPPARITAAGRKICSSRTTGPTFTRMRRSKFRRECDGSPGATETPEWRQMHRFLPVYDTPGKRALASLVPKRDVMHGDEPARSSFLSQLSEHF